MSRPDHDVLICGGGLAGLSLAVSLKTALGAELRVVVVDPRASQPALADGRASAFAAAGRRMFTALGVWGDCADRAQAITEMIVTDSRTHDVVRPVFLTFSGEVEPGEPFAHMLMNADVVNALSARARALGVQLLDGSVSGLSRAPERASITLSSGEVIGASVVVACDGARSRVRDMVGITTVGWGYDQSGIVCTVAHERDHGGRAEEHFLPAGPFAILPLPGRRSSIVWTEETGRAERLCALPRVLFQDELETRFGHRLGEIEVVDTPRAYPLGLTIARDFVSDRVALVGDAAHVIHPIAGQGINMGLRDVAALAECLAEAARLGLDMGGPGVLERYQRWRRFDTLAMGATTDVLNRLFSNRFDVLRLVRDTGLGIVDRLPSLKQFFIAQAAGITGDVPRLMRGEAL